MGVFPECMSVYNMHALCSQRPEEGIEAPGTEILDGCEPLCGCWEMNLASLEEQPVNVTTELSLQPT